MGGLVCDGGGPGLFRSVGKSWKFPWPMGGARGLARGVGAGRSFRIHCRAPPALVHPAKATPFPGKARGTTATATAFSAQNRSDVHGPRGTRSADKPYAAPPPLPEPKSTTPTHSNAHKNTALHSPPTPRGQGSAEDAAGMCRRHSMGASQGSVWLNSQKIPRPTPCRGSGPAPSPWAPPTPMPRRRCPLAREPATPRLSKPLRTSRRPAPPYRAKGREVPKGAARMCRR